MGAKYMRTVRGEEPYIIVSALRSFHGRGYGAMAATGQPEKSKLFGPVPQGFIHVPFNDLSALEESVSDDTCAVLLEPIQGEGGVYVADPGYLKGARGICREKGALLTRDEVQSGMGRTGALFAHEHYGISPDMMTIAKGLAGGVPIGGCLATGDVAKGVS